MPNQKKLKHGKESMKFKIQWIAKQQIRPKCVRAGALEERTEEISQNGTQGDKGKRIKASLRDTEDRSRSLNRNRRKYSQKN